MPVSASPEGVRTTRPWHLWSMALGPQRRLESRNVHYWGLATGHLQQLLRISRNGQANACTINGAQPACPPALALVVSLPAALAGQARTAGETGPRLRPPPSLLPPRAAAPVAPWPWRSGRTGTPPPAPPLQGRGASPHFRCACLTPDGPTQLQTTHCAACRTGRALAAAPRCPRHTRGEAGLPFPHPTCQPAAWAPSPPPPPSCAG